MSSRNRKTIGAPPSFRDHRPAPSARYVGICPVTGKRQYVSRKDARDAKRAQGASDLHVFPCRACGRFELGSKHGMSRAQHESIAQYKMQAGIQGSIRNAPARTSHEPTQAAA